MRKLIALASLVTALAAAVAAGGGVANADNNAAVHVAPVTYGLFDGDGTPVGPV
jgi:hypothetical protein